MLARARLPGRKAAPCISAWTFFAALLIAVGLAVVNVEAAVIQTRRVATGFNSPLYGVAPPGDTQRLFVLEKNTGQIRILNLATGAINGTAFLTVPNISTNSERGLLGMAFDPDYNTNGLFYVNFTDASGTTNVVRYQASGTPATATTANAGSATTILQIAQPFDNHNGGWMDFGPDGYLYIASGDGGSGNDPNNNAQNLNTNLGKMLRIDVSSDAFPADPLRNYAIPPSNPFAGATPGNDEIWAYGLRNPWRNSFDRETGELYIADVGQNAREEINVQRTNSAGGENYGWRLREGTIQTPAAGVGGAPPPGNVEPLYDYAHGTGALQGDSVTGGYVYRGPVLDLQGEYFFGDFIRSRVWSLTHNGNETTHATSVSSFTNWLAQGSFAPNAGAINNVASFAQDGLGRLYIIDFDGEIFRITSDAFTQLAAGANISGQVSGGSSVVGGTSVTFDNITLAGEFGSQYVVETLSELDAGIAAAIHFPHASEPVQRWQVDFFGQFTGDVQLTFAYDDADLLVPEDELNIYHYAGGNWVLLPLVSRDALNNRLTVLTDSFSPFMLGGTVAVNTAVIPEPSSLLLAVLALAGLTFAGRARVVRRSR